MAFGTPTTKEEMYAILKDIYRFYRIDNKSPLFEGLKELDLQRLEYVPLNEEELTTKALELVKHTHDREIYDYKKSISGQIQEKSNQLEALSKNLTEQILIIENNFTSQKESLDKECVEKNLLFSDVYLDRLNNLILEKDDKIQKLRKASESQTDKIEGEIQALELEQSNWLEWINDVHNHEVVVKLHELRDAQNTTTMEVFKYNNQLDEKEQRYANTLQTNIASLRIRLIEASGQDFTKSQLVDMGYYPDVLKCVYDYFDTLEPEEAYNEFKRESALLVYLEDFYDQVLNRYKQNSLET